MKTAYKLQLKYQYSLRLGVLVLGALALVIGAVMEFHGLQGSFNWAVDAPHAVGAKLTNAPPGIVYGTIGMLLCIVSVLNNSVKFQTGADGTVAIHQSRPRHDQHSPAEARSHRVSVPAFQSRRIPGQRVVSSTSRTVPENIQAEFFDQSCRHCHWVSIKRRVRNPSKCFLNLPL